MYRLDRSKRRWDIFTDLNIGACIIILSVLILIIGCAFLVASTPNSNYPATLFFIFCL